MIWSVVSKEEMKSCTSSPTFVDYSREIGEDKVKLAVVEESDALEFVTPNDIVILRTASQDLVNAIKERGAYTTAEEYQTYRLASDKLALTNKLLSLGVKMAPLNLLEDIVEGKTYFVKPRFGNDSNVSSSNICKTKAEVVNKIEQIKTKFEQDSIICDYLCGKEYTVACVRIGSDVHAYPIDINDYNKKLGCDIESLLRAEAVKICDKLGILHHARIDFCSDTNDRIYAIDVNLIPSIGQDGKWAKCFNLAGFSYRESIESVIRTSTKL